MKARPQPGPQEQFLSSSADVVIYGGAAGGGKTWSLLVDDLYHVHNPKYASITFRRTFPQIRNPGGLWDEAEEIYPYVGGVPNQTALEWRFGSGAIVKFAHMQYETDKTQWQGSQVPVIKFDELTHFTESMFFYMLSRNRSMSGIRPYMRATCNADADSWVADFIAWWIDQDTGLPVPERAGVMRWFVRSGGQLLWADRAKDLPWVEVEIDGEMVPQPPKTCTFIPAKVTDNKALLAKDPGYLATLLALPPVDQARLLEGNWKIREAAGNQFRRQWFEIVDAAPAQAQRVRYWDLAATEVTRPGHDPDWTAGAKVSRTPDGTWFIEDIRRTRDTPGGVENLLRQTAQLDGVPVPIHIEQEPGSSGKFTVNSIIRQTLAGYAAYGVPSTGKKLTRAKPVSSQAQAGNVKLVRPADGENWIPALLSEMEMFPDGSHDDQVDAVSGAFAAIVSAAGPTADRIYVGPPRTPSQAYTR